MNADTVSIIISIIQLLGGLALFLYGMNVLGAGLEKISGSSMERVLQKLTSNPIKGVLLGAIITACIQSSSATTVVVVGLVNAGILKLYSAVGVIMGANIGTTITAQILRLGDLDDSAGLYLQFIKPTTLAPMVAIIGILIFMTAKRSKYKDLGQILIGFGILFGGMFSMEGAVNDNALIMASAKDLFEALTNPFLGVLVGALVTGIIQSSSASVGILQALSTTGAVTLGSAFPIIMGQNIGTCVTPLIASIGAGKNAKRAAMVHLYFNIIGTVIFLAGVYAFQYTIGFSFWSEPLNRGGIANFHTIFNIVTTSLLLPFSKLLARLAERTIKDHGFSDEDEEITVNKELDERLLVSPGVALAQVKESVARMGTFAYKNCRDAVTLFDGFESKTYDRIQTREEKIDRMEDSVSAYLVKLVDQELSDSENREVTEYLHIVSEYERVGDYAINLTEQAQNLFEKNIQFTDKAKEELMVVTEAVLEIINASIETFMDVDKVGSTKVEPLEETIDIMVEHLKRKHIERLKNGKCAVESGVAFLESLTNFERMSDHCSNVAVYVLAYATGVENLNRHQYISALHKGEGKEYIKAMEEYKGKYLVRIE